MLSNFNVIVDSHFIASSKKLNFVILKKIIALISIKINLVSLISTW